MKYIVDDWTNPPHIITKYKGVIFHSLREVGLRIAQGETVTVRKLKDVGKMIYKAQTFKK